METAAITNAINELTRLGLNTMIFGLGKVLCSFGLAFDDCSVRFVEFEFEFDFELIYC